MSENVLRIMCPNLKCRAVLGVPVKARGKLVRCRACGNSIKVPATAKAVAGGGVSPAPAETDASGGASGDAAA